MEKLNLYIDFDGVILDTITPIYDEINTKGLTDKEEIQNFYINYPWKNIIDDKHIIGNGIEDIKKIIESDKFNLAILTHINSLNEAACKIKYLRKYFKDITIIPCPKEISKTKMVHTENAILVDDYAGNLREWEKENGIPVRFSLKGNGKGFKTVKELKELITMF